ncbi:MAG: urease accessory protein [Rhodospirillales bacterium]|jgi:ABC-type nickel/cobalt efflux system permease component RcnA|nr:urease accessory protein [Rhodospirillales bacterium]
MLSILAMGFLLGVQHAMEADHIAAVASITAGQSRFSRFLRHGLFWGIGHALALSAFAGCVVMLRGEIPEELGASIEFFVGLMLIFLGSMVIWRLIQQQVHFHVHRHADKKVHFHAHDHAGEVAEHDKNRHQHDHAPGGVRRSLFVGIMHGMAGSAALIALATPGQWIQGMGFVLLFGAGSIAGMVMITSVVALPLALTGRVLTGLNRSLQAVVGVASIIIGGVYAYSQAPAILGLIESL